MEVLLLASHTPVDHLEHPLGCMHPSLETIFLQDKTSTVWLQLGLSKLSFTNLLFKHSTESLADIVIHLSSSAPCFYSFILKLVSKVYLMNPKHVFCEPKRCNNTEKGIKKSN